MKIEYLCGADNKVADALSGVESCLNDNEIKQFLDTIVTEKAGSLNESTMKEVIDRARYRHIPRTESDNPALMAHHEELEEQVAVDLASLVATRNIKHNLTGTNWKILQEKDPILQHVLVWKKPYRKLTKKEKQEIRDSVSKDMRDRQALEEYLSSHINAFDAKLYGNQQNNLVLQNDLLYMKETPKNSTEEVLLFIVPACKRQATLDLCHRNVGHQGRDDEEHTELCHVQDI